MRFLILAALVGLMALATVGGLVVTSTQTVGHEYGTPPLETSRAPYRPVVSTPTPTPTATTAKYTAVTKVVKRKGVSYLEASIRYGAAGRFTVRQKVCKGKSCRTVTSEFAVTTGAGKKTTKLGKGSYRLSGKPVISVKVLPWPTKTVTVAPTATVTVAPTATTTATVTTGPTVTQSVPGPTTTISVTATVTFTATATVTATPTVTVTAPATTITVTAAPAPNKGCDAPWNPFRYHYCASPTTDPEVTAPPADVCTYFVCLTSPLPAPTASQRLVFCGDGKITLAVPSPSPDPCAANGALKGVVRVAPAPQAAADPQGLAPAPTPSIPELTPAPGQ
ncbi:hypothetical protein ACIBG7_39460 [Nonomuraea sp. NPDC050328]|uniref:hypothetical protein n=1 Tax=Nonomuraea sp. NPDC050328 TaxID=3364361 RepID=UPI0037B4D479